MANSKNFKTAWAVLNALALVAQSAIWVFFEYALRHWQANPSDRLLTTLLSSVSIVYWAGVVIGLLNLLVFVRIFPEMKTFRTKQWLFVALMLANTFITLFATYETFISRP
jgi:hypothetical protein